MTVELLREFLLWCLVINFGLLTMWFLFIALAGDMIYRLHGKWFKMPRETFDAIHYSGMAFFKIIVFVFNAVPYIALLIVG